MPTLTTVNADVAVQEPPAFPQQFVRDSGELTDEAYIFLYQLWQRTGGYAVDFNRIGVALQAATPVAVDDGDFSLGSKTSSVTGEGIEGLFYFVKFEGTLSQDITVTLQDRAGSYLMYNATTGGFDITIVTPSDGTGKVIENGRYAFISMDEDFVVHDPLSVTQQALLGGDAAGQATEVTFPTATVASADIILGKDADNSNAFSGFSAQSIADLNTAGESSATVQTTGVTETTLVALSMASNTGRTVRGWGHGYESATGDIIHFWILAGGNNVAGTSTLTEYTANLQTNAGSVNWEVLADVDDTADELRIRVIGEAAHTIDWTLRYVSITT